MYRPFSSVRVPKLVPGMNTWTTERGDRSVWSKTCPWILPGAAGTELCPVAGSPTCSWAASGSGASSGDCPLTHGGQSQDQQQHQRDLAHPSPRFHRMVFAGSKRVSTSPGRIRLRAADPSENGSAIVFRVGSGHGLGNSPGSDREGRV